MERPNIKLSEIEGDEELCGIIHQLWKYCLFLESTTEKQEPDSVNVSQKKENIINILNKRLIIANESDSNVSLPRKFIKDFINFLSLQEPRQTKSAEVAKEIRIFVQVNTADDHKSDPWIEERIIELITLQSVPERPEQKEEIELISDSEGSQWPKICAMCHKPSMQVVRPGKVQCEHCG